jgi:uncharacterized membrane protein YsdA (DUF1294 family)
VETVIKYFGKHPALLLSLLYLYLSVLGFLYSWNLFRVFELDIFGFSEANDYLLMAFRVAFRTPETFILNAANVLAGSIGLIAMYFTRKKVGNLRFYSGTVAVVAVVGTVLLFWATYSSGGNEAREIKNGTGDKYAVVARPDLLLPVGVTGGEALLLIGTTDKFAFMYSQTLGRALIIPISSISFMTQIIE